MSLSSNFGDLNVVCPNFNFFFPEFSFLGPVSYPGPFAYPHTSSNPYSPLSNRNNNQPPGKFHSQQASPKPSATNNQNSQQLDFEQSGPDRNSYISHRIDQDYENKYSHPSKKPSITSSDLGKPTKTKTEVDQNVDQYYAHLGSEPNYSNQQNKPPSSRPSLGDRDYNQQGNIPSHNGQNSSFTGNYQSAPPQFAYQPDSILIFQPGQQSFRPSSPNRQSANSKPYIQRENEEKFEDYKPITEFSWNLFRVLF